MRCRTARKVTAAFLLTFPCFYSVCRFTVSCAPLVFPAGAAPWFHRGATQHQRLPLGTAVSLLDCLQSPHSGYLSRSDFFTGSVIAQTTWITPESGEGSTVHRDAQGRDSRKAVRCLWLAFGLQAGPCSSEKAEGAQVCLWVF